MGADELLCSRNARPPKALVGRAQWKFNQPSSLKNEQASLEGASVASFAGGREANMGALPVEETRARANRM